MKSLKKISLFTTLFALLLSFSVATSYAQTVEQTTTTTTDSTYIVKGKVVDSQTMDTISDATIMIKGTEVSTTSDENGEFKLTNLPAGTHTLQVKVDGYQAWEKDMTLTENSELTVKLKPEEQ